MMFDDHDDAWRTWVDFHEQFNAPYSQEEMEMLDVLKIRYDRETGRDDD